LAKSFAVVVAIVAASAFRVLGLSAVARSSDGPEPAVAPSIPAFHLGLSSTQTTAAQATPAQTATSTLAAPTHGKHTISVKFDYDFKLSPACTATTKINCVQQFVVYDISAGNRKNLRYKLFSVPLPADPTGQVKAIQGTSPTLDFESGQHLIAVIATRPDLSESNSLSCGSCRTWITIP
jgi:hypothetical protein